MKKQIIFITLILLISSLVLSEDFEGDKTNMFDMVMDSRVGCAINDYYMNSDYMDLFLNIAPGPIGAFKRETTFISGVTTALISSDSYCKAAEDSVILFMNTNNITDPYQQINTEEDYQLGLEEFVYEEEKELLLANINTVWDYVKLISALVIEFLLIIFYIIEYKIMRYFILELIPMLFFGIRDGLTNMFIVKERKKQLRDNGA